jgi:membrane protein implicated in regulation of membrane protease activity
MYAGHLAIALAVQSRSPNVPAWVFTFGALLLDIVGGLNLALGLSGFVPDSTAGLIAVRITNCDWDHSLLMAVVWSTLYAIAAWAFVRARGGSTSGVAKYAYAMGLTHWVLDALVHNADMPLYPGSKYKFGLSLWSLTPWGSWFLEAYLCGLMTVIYFRNYDALGLSGSKLYKPLYLIFVSLLTLLPPISLPKHIASLMPEDGVLETGNRVLAAFVITVSSDLVPGWILAKQLEKVKTAIVKTKKKE